MELIKIIFFALGSFFGIENSNIIAEKTQVIIDIENHVIEVEQHDLFAIIRNEQDSIRVSQELYRIGNRAAGDKHYKFRSEFDSYTSKTSEIVYHKKEQRIDASIKLRYNTPADLKDFAIDYVPEDDSYALINVDSWNIETTTGVLKGNYWYFKDQISFSLSPAATMPEKYKSYKTSLYTYWLEVKP